MLHCLVLLAGLYGGLRGRELVAVRCWGLTFAQERVLLHISKSNTDRAGVGAVMLLPKLEDLAVCPVTYFTRYKELVHTPERLLFRQYRNSKFTWMPPGNTSIGQITRITAMFLILDNPVAQAGHALRVFPLKLWRTMAPCLWLSCSMACGPVARWPRATCASRGLYGLKQLCFSPAKLSRPHNLAAAASKSTTCPIRLLILTC